jgi:hypothetical protein
LHKIFILAKSGCYISSFSFLTRETDLNTHGAILEADWKSLEETHTKVPSHELSAEIPFSISKFSLNLIQTSKIRIKFNIYPNFMKWILLFI